MAANSIRSDGSDCIVAGGVESISIPGGGSPKESIGRVVRAGRRPRAAVQATVYEQYCLLRCIREAG